MITHWSYWNPDNDCVQDHWRGEVLPVETKAARYYRRGQALDELSEQAQELDMGYGPVVTHEEVERGVDWALREEE